MPIAHHETRKWGAGELTIGFESDGRWIVADFRALGKSYGPVKLYDLPEAYLDSERMKWAVKETFSMFDARGGGEKYFIDLFGPEAGDLAYEEHRKKVKAAREVIGHPEAVKIAADLIHAWYIEHPRGSGKTPFDNYAMVNKLQDATFGKFSFEEMMKILREAMDRVHDGPSMGASKPKYATVGARELAKAGYTGIKEIRLVGKGPGLWYEAVSPKIPLSRPQDSATPRDWSPRWTEERKFTKGEGVLVLRQGSGIWHVFYRGESTSSGGDPLGALTGGLGDAIGSDNDLERYCELVLSAPQRLAEEYDGLYAAQGQCYHDKQE
jgi:hypothetical protein